MSGAPQVRSMNVADSEGRLVLGPAGNKAGSFSSRKSGSKPLRKVERSPEEGMRAQEKKTHTSSPKSHSTRVPSILSQHEQLLHSNLSLNASCSSDASTDSFHSRASTGRITRRNSLGSRRKQYASKPRSVVSEGGSESPPHGSQTKKQCAWVTPNTDPSYAAFHDEEWGVPVHDDKKLFELLVLSGALAELTWPAILSRRHIFREVFLHFDPLAVAKLNEKKILSPGSTASSLLSELKLRAILENARQISKVLLLPDHRRVWVIRQVYLEFRKQQAYSEQIPLPSPSSSQNSKSRRDEQRSSEKGFPERKPHSHLLIHAGGWHYKRPSRRLLQIPGVYSCSRGREGGEWLWRHG